MRNLRLVTPSKQWVKSYKKALAEHKQESPQPESLTHEQNALDTYLKRWDQEKDKVARFWLVDDDEYIGTIQIRLTPTSSRPDIPKNHLYYDIRPSMRGEGLGTHLLALGIKKVRQLGLRAVSIVCREDNIASRKIIEKNGGILQKTTTTETGEVFLLYQVIP